MKSAASEDEFYLDDLRVFLNGAQESFLSGIAREELDGSYYPVMTEWVGRNGRKLADKVVRMIDYADIKNFLAGNGREMKSAFVRYLGESSYLATHQFRRLMDTSLREGGISENELALLQGRANPAQNAVYDYRTPDERARDVREAIRHGEGYGWVASAYWSIPADEREEFLGSVLQVAYRTPVGHCLTNIVETGCPYFLQCLSGCGDYLHVKGDEIAVAGLRKQQEWASNTLHRLEEAEASEPNLAESVRNHRAQINQQLKTIERVMSIEENETIPAGEPIRIYPMNETFAEELAE